MSHLLASIITGLTLVSAWAPAAAEQFIAPAGTGSTAGEQQSSGKPDCNRQLYTALADSRISARRVIGMEVVNPLNQDIGRVVDLVLDRCAMVTHVVVQVGGFLGFGGERVAVPVDKVRIQTHRSSSTAVALVRETRQHLLNGYEEYSRGEPAHQ